VQINVERTLIHDPTPPRRVCRPRFFVTLLLAASFIQDNTETKILDRTSTIETPDDPVTTL